MVSLLVPYHYIQLFDRTKLSIEEIVKATHIDNQTKKGVIGLHLEGPYIFQKKVLEVRILKSLFAFP